ncbi:MAG: efflux RND transporter periplasmic adaptor subunit [Polyangiaceae bacterium]
MTAEVGSEHRPGSERANRWLLVSLGVATLVTVFLIALLRAHEPAAMSEAGAPETREVPVVIATVTTRDVPIYLEGLGNVVPLNTVTVRTQVDGMLTSVRFKEGQEVDPGDVLAQVDSRPFQIQQQQGEANLVRDQAQLANAQLALTRDETLLPQKLIAQQAVDDQRTLALQALGAVKADQAQIASAKLQLTYARIVSPIHGVTGIRQVDPGNIVHPADATGIVILTQLDPISVIFTLPQDDLQRVMTGLKEHPLALDAYSRDGATKLGSGTLALVDNQVNVTTGTIRLKAIVANPNRLLWPSLFVKARLLVTTLRGALVVPATVVQRGPQGTFAYVIGGDQTVSVRPLTMDSTQGETAIIARGLSPGERVVADGQSQLRAGAKVSARAGRP